jgi:hypothetical protein
VCILDMTPPAGFEDCRFAQSKETPLFTNGHYRPPYLLPARTKAAWRGVC